MRRQDSFNLGERAARLSAMLDVLLMSVKASMFNACES
jgi:hypothetical protein